MEEETRKTIASIYVDCLRYSEKYQDLCEWKRKQKIDPSITIPEKFQELYTLGHDNTLIYLYYRYGDVCLIDFDFKKWWGLYKYIVPLSFDFDANFLPSPVSSYKDLVGKDIQNTIDIFTQINGHAPSLQEFKDFFIDICIDSFPLVHVVIDASIDTADLNKSFRKFLADKKKDPIFEQSQNNRYRHRRPVKSQKITSLRKAMDVFIDFDSGKRDFEISYYKDSKSSIEDVRSMISVDLKRAKQLIANVEKGQMSF